MSDKDQARIVMLGVTYEVESVIYIQEKISSYDIDNNSWDDFTPFTKTNDGSVEYPAAISAEQVYNGQVGSSSSGVYSESYYMFVTTSTSEYTILVDNLSADADVDIFLYGGDGEFIAEATSYSESGEILSVDLEAVSLCTIKVVNYTDVDISYHISVSAGVVSTPSEPASPNDGDANNPAEIQTNQTYNGYIGSANDIYYESYYKFITPINGDYTVTIDNLNVDADIDIAMYRSDDEEAIAVANSYSETGEALTVTLEAGSWFTIRAINYALSDVSYHISVLSSASSTPSTSGYWRLVNTESDDNLRVDTGDTDYSDSILTNEVRYHEIYTYFNGTSIFGTSLSWDPLPTFMYEGDELTINLNGFITEVFEPFYWYHQIYADISEHKVGCGATDLHQTDLGSITLDAKNPSTESSSESTIIKNSTEFGHDTIVIRVCSGTGSHSNGSYYYYEWVNN